MKLLVPLDLSDATDKVLEVVRRTVRATGAQVWLLHVAEPDPAFVGYEAGPAVVRDQVAAEYRGQHEQLQAHARQLREEGIDVTALLVQGPSAATILAEADRLEAGLIVMATHGHGAMFDLLVGSVSHAVLRHSPIPVLLVPARTHA
ncbi:MAG TPA: universal stress protein [Xanthomonadaceae bacterium]|nr:universal stress protein [Xanthomonadaceae bacterium]